MVVPAAKSLVISLLAVLGLTVLLVAPASAQGCPVPPNHLTVRFTAVTVGQQTGGLYAAQIDSVVDCVSASGQTIGQVPATYEVWTEGVNGVFINGSPSQSHQTVPAPGSLIVTYPQNVNLSQIQWFANIGGSGVQAFNGWVSSGSSPLQLGNILARTPELGSLALFGAGAAGMAGYAVTRFRARRRD
jgi:hypothetical protein